jgi:hypothetical protein
VGKNKTLPKGTSASGKNKTQKKTKNNKDSKSNLIDVNNLSVDDAHRLKGMLGIADWELPKLKPAT